MPEPEVNYIEAGRRLAIRKSEWLENWWVGYSPRNDNENDEGTWEHWVELAKQILELDGTAAPKPTGPTPGPWMVMGSYPLLTIVEVQEDSLGGHTPVLDTYANHPSIGDVYRGLPRTQEECEANASRLAAAPEMVDVLEDLCYAEPDDMDAVWERARRVLAKAKGESV